MGRKFLDPSLRSRNMYSIRTDNHDLMRGLQEIAKRERLNFNDIAIKAFEEFLDRHGPGNSQTLLDSFEPEGIKSDGQLETEVFRLFESRFMDVLYREVIEELKRKGFTGQKLVEAAKRVCKALKAEGLKVYQ